MSYEHRHIITAAGIVCEKEPTVGMLLQSYIEAPNKIWWYKVFKCEFKPDIITLHVELYRRTTHPNIKPTWELKDGATLYQVGPLPTEPAEVTHVGEWDIL